jgi:hypothetical protein
MEIFLQWYDDLDDLMGAVRFAWPRILGFLLAVTLFAATGWACILLPKVFLTVAAALVSFFLVELIRNRLVSARG